MRMILTASALLLLILGNAWAGSGYDSCIKEEQALKAQEASECHGFRYLLNPSACFGTQKKLKEYTSTDKCRKISLAEKVDFSAPPVIPEKKVTAITTTGTTTGSAVSPDGVGKTGAVSPLAVINAETAVPQQESTCEQLKEENARLKAEVSRLTTELEQYTKACR